MSPQRFAAWAAVAMIFATAIARVVPHAWNFTPLIAMALFGGAKLRAPIWGVVATLASLLLGDLALGLFPYPGIGWVYGATVGVVLIGTLLRGRRSIGALVAATLGGGALFYLLTNFGVWAGGSLYPRTLSGLAACLVAGIPFYRNQVLGDLLFVTLLFGAHALAVAARYRLHSSTQA